MILHSVLFDRSVYNPTTAKQWLRNHNLKEIRPYNLSNKYVRFRIKDPKGYTNFVTKKEGNITFVFMSK